MALTTNASVFKALYLEVADLNSRILSGSVVLSAKISVTAFLRATKLFLVPLSVRSIFPLPVVKSNTGDRIDHDFKKFDSNTVMNIINTVYFKSDWEQQFDGQNTSDGEFETPSGSKTVKFMHGEYTRYFENTLLQGIILPYDDDKSSMMILLPKTNLDDMLSKMTAADLTGYVKDNMNSETKAKLTLPRVNLSYNASLNDTLKVLGLKSAFDPNQANFGGMTKTDSNLYISKVTHMTYLAIDEKGTEAAAATAVQMCGSAAPPSKENTIVVDHPFLTAIVNNESGAVLFVGAVTDPSVSQ
jgi:serpin B